MNRDYQIEDKPLDIEKLTKKLNKLKKKEEEARDAKMKIGDSDGIPELVVSFFLSSYFQELKDVLLLESRSVKCRRRETALDRARA